jgi:2'-5' RNA ligase
MTLLACLMLERVSPQQRFSIWPLHLTIVPWFEIGGNSLSEFITQLEALVASFSPIRLATGDTAYFGPNRVKVTLIVPSQELSILHKKLFSIICENGGRLLKDNHIPNDFQPHVTNRGARGPSRKEITCRQMQIVAKIADSNERQIVQKLNFAKA